MKIDIEFDLKSDRLVFHGSIASVLVINPRESERYDVHNVPISRVYDDTGSDGQWFAFWEEDCHAPPVYIVRADSFETAYEIFCEEFVQPLDEDTLKDYEQTSEGDYEGLTLTGKGWISSESIQGHEIELREVTLS